MAPAPKGAAEVFSFHATKILNTFEGGLVATDDDEIHARVRSMHNFGFDDAMEVAGPGTNAKMSESSAAMGIASIERLDDTLSTYRSLHLRCRDGLDEVPGVTLIEAPAGQTHNHQYVVVRVDPGAAGFDRDRLFDILGAENIRTKKYFAPGCHRMPPYRADAVHTPLDLPATEELAGRVLALPIGALGGAGRRGPDLRRDRGRGPPRLGGPRPPGHRDCRRSAEPTSAARPSMCSAARRGPFCARYSSRSWPRCPASGAPRCRTPSSRPTSAEVGTHRWARR
ncbi:DegT/DnrJ/EryC1/StrS family aminotransferase [Streptomyces sp. NPDC050844]|uniref:DegT/DnrJ/EryC1/StrS family aminotransferase n=1 Tax=Streptomyces sp. NPDC050844 TaxID=3155790 RepID=UPI0033C73799